MNSIRQKPALVRKEGRDGIKDGGKKVSEKMLSFANTVSKIFV